MHFSTVASGHFRPYCYIIRWSAGVGKTGVCSKLANYLKKGEMPLVGVPVYKAGTEVKPYETEKKGLEEAKKKKVDVGRLQVISIASVMKFDATSSGYSSMQIIFLLLLVLQEERGDQNPEGSLQNTLQQDQVHVVLVQRTRKLIKF
ncbi:hypothetical protein Goari_025935 [Gossypium aridum]|uniref:SRP54-type proteins GTP-binding domain-containing protein n=1 Tax=Gossypium aridum TaxID=34290 RepID=A0A7J8XAP8_GOSAI|nr:hypothetical protein [Gossypium aridum]